MMIQSYSIAVAVVAVNVFAAHDAAGAISDPAFTAASEIRLVGTMTLTITDWRQRRRLL